MKTKYKVSIIIFAVIIALLAIGTALFLSSPEYMLIKLYYDVENHGNSAMYSYMTDDFTKQIKYFERLSQSGFGTFIQKHFAEPQLLDIFENSEITLKKTEHKKENATAFISFSSNNSSEFSAEIYIINTDSGWKIDGFGNVSKIK